MTTVAYPNPCAAYEAPTATRARTVATPGVVVVVLASVIAGEPPGARGTGALRRLRAAAPVREGFAGLVTCRTPDQVGRDLPDTWRAPGPVTRVSGPTAQARAPGGRWHDREVP
ncbi:hypothetical protein GCM10023113_06560 [Cellulomonas oligotrophica]|uniref:Uncharacterized protein n=1 Tax=Cellulomonas oligotrophica TaxID=931536 RepID=A0ABQ4D9H1_9CELL|nr:hypothetical protein Col01nite_15490 [Cellulomonas oligotrophica]